MNCTCVVSQTFYGSYFWSNRVLQLSLTEPAIRYALCSLSALHRYFRADQTINQLANKSTSSENDRIFSLNQYTKAVSYTQKLLAQSSTGDEDAIMTGLTVCILFVCYENLQTNYDTAQMHLQNGLKIIAKYYKASCSRALNPRELTSRCQAPEDIIQVFNRLDLQAMSYSEARAPYPYHLNQQDCEFPAAVSPVTSIDESMSYLIILFGWVFRVASTSEPHPIPQSELDKASTALAQWQTEFCSLITSPATQPESSAKHTRHNNTITLLKIYHTVIQILLATKVYAHEMLHDTQLQRYAYITNLSKSFIKPPHDSPLFSFEIGIILPLFFTATKCRDPYVRREAITLLKSMNHQEGSWESCAAACVADFVRGIEEDSFVLEKYTKQEQVPEVMRVHQLNISLCKEKRRIHVKCILFEDLGAGDWYQRDGIVYY